MPAASFRSYGARAYFLLRQLPAVRLEAFLEFGLATRSARAYNIFYKNIPP